VTGNGFPAGDPCRDRLVAALMPGAAEMVFGREKSLRLGEGSFQTHEDFLVPENRTKYQYDGVGREIGVLVQRMLIAGTAGGCSPRKA